jgi:hypothetical protein
LSFFAHTFVFDGIPSETYNLYISSPSGGDVSTNGSTNVEMYYDQPYRRPVPYLLGVKLGERLSFPVSINTPYELTAEEAMLVQKWLFGYRQYKVLRIVQSDMQNVYFNAILNSPKIKRTGNLITGFDCDVECDAPWGWEDVNPRTVNFATPPSSYVININNTSDDIAAYLKPTVEVTMNGTGGNASFINYSDAYRTTNLIALSANEVITMNSDLTYLESSTGLNRIKWANFNGKWIRFIPGINVWHVTGNIAKVVFTYKFARKVGG